MRRKWQQQSMEIKIMAPLRAGFKITPKFGIEMLNHRLKILSQQVIMWLSIVPVCSPDNIWAFCWWVAMVSWENSTQNWTVCGGTWWCQIHQNVTFRRFSDGFMSREQEGQSMVSMASSSRKCLHTLNTRGRATTCTSIRNDNRSEDFILLPKNRQGTSSHDCANLHGYTSLTLVIFHCHNDLYLGFSWMNK